ncbi:MAG TPA: acyltransferase family protein [Candidatus Limnocylindria bacterium]|jgi:peptidoglycan/LPS O-acetylase OafA/YrhL|nr:acyltransferase family protein [Candidatus Limnocylindria bacterium]
MPAPFRGDLEGLRGLAVVLVVLFHARLLGLSGGFVGVDVFYVLSGFLITGLLLRELVTGGTLDLAAFYVRRARRILPAAIVAIVVTLAAAAFIVAPLDLPAVALDGTASALFVGNLLFASRATDYFASTTPSPFLHYWSLGVEEQFYLVWPILLLIAARLRRLSAFVLLIFCASLALSLAVTPTDAAFAFYGLPTRAWQLALGALLAIHAARFAGMRDVPAVISGWIGLGLVAASAVALDAMTTYPGVASLAPTFGAALLIVSGGRSWAPGRLLTFPPLRALGRISFSLYLYHWPVLTLAAVAAGPLSEELRWLLVAAAVLISALSWWLVEERFRRAPPVARSSRRPLAFAAAAVCAVAVIAQLVAVGGADAVTRRGESLAADLIPVVDPSIAAPGAVVAGTSSVVSSHSDPGPLPTTSSAVEIAPAIAAKPELHPRLSDARDDGDGLNERGCGLSLAGSQPPLCRLGDPDGQYTVALVGDSHASQWFPALEVIARERGWRVLPLTKDSCIFLDMRITSLHLEREYTECALWRTAVVKALAREKPDLVLVSSSRWVHPVDPVDADLKRQGAAMARLLTALPGRVAVIADTPLSAYDVPACLSRPTRPPDGCSTSRSYALTSHLARDKIAAELSRAWLIDPAEWICGSERCPAIIDWTIVYRDDHHLTATYARAVAPLLEASLAEIVASPVATAR